MKDDSAHAWVEIYLESDGWVPVEVTPAGDGSTVASYPGFNQEKLRGIWRSHGWDVSVPSLSARWSGGTGGVQESESGFLSALGLDWLSDGDVWLLLGITACLAAVILPLSLLFRRTRLLSLAEKGGCCVVYERLIELLHFGGRLKDFDGTEDDFAERLAEATCLSLEESEKLVDTVNRAAYSPFPPDAKNVSFVRSVYRRVAQETYRSLPPHRRFSFKWRKGFA